MKAFQDKRLLACVIAGVMLMQIFEPILEESLFDVQIHGVIPAGIKGAIAALAGYGVYRLFFRPKISV
jgi:hypothetical protein